MLKNFFENLSHYHDGLNAIADILIYRYYFKGTGKREKRFVDGLCSMTRLDEKFITKLKKNNNGDKPLALRNLLNSWYSECALRYPFTETEDYERIKFASWKIIQFYYTIFTGLSSLNRDFYNKKWNHDKAINLFVEKLLYNPKLNQRFFNPPFCFILDEDEIKPSFDKVISWDYGLECHCPRIEKCLRNTPKTGPKISVFTFLKTYENGLHIKMHIYLLTCMVKGLKPN